MWLQYHKILQFYSHEIVTLLIHFSFCKSRKVYLIRRYAMDFNPKYIATNLNGYLNPQEKKITFLSLWIQLNQQSSTIWPDNEILRRYSPSFPVALNPIYINNPRHTKKNRYVSKHLYHFLQSASSCYSVEPSERVNGRGIELFPAV